jgi:hypothetical protein
VTVSGIYLAPTIDVDKDVVKQGHPLTIFGQSSATSTISIMVNSSQELYFETPSDNNGVYSYTFITSPLELGNHSTHSLASKSGQVSNSSNAVAFQVGTQDVVRSQPGKGTCGPRGDLNCDGHVNLIDFSIEAHWYKKKGFPAAYDLNGDGKIDLVDFSIMASNWTG